MTNETFKITDEITEDSFTVEITTGKIKHLQQMTFAEVAMIARLGKFSTVVNRLIRGRVNRAKLQSLPSWNTDADVVFVEPWSDYTGKTGTLESFDDSMMTVTLEDGEKITKNVDCFQIL